MNPWNATRAEADCCQGSKRPEEGPLVQQPGQLLLAQHGAVFLYLWVSVEKNCLVTLKQFSVVVILMKEDSLTAADNILTFRIACSACLLW